MAGPARRLDAPETVAAAAAGMPMALVDGSDVVCDANFAFLCVCDAPLERAVGLTLADAMKAAVRETATFGGGEAWRVERDGRDTWVKLVRVPAGRGALVYLVDATQERAAWTRAASAMRDRAKLMTEAEIGVWRYDPDREEYYFSEELGLGWSHGVNAVPLATLRLVQHPDDQAKDEAIRGRLTREGGSAEGEMRYRDAKGGWRTLNVLYRAVNRLPSGRYEMFGLSQNVSELARARDAATAATAAKSNFLASMSHEIRTPLNGVLGMAQVLLGEDLPEEQRGRVALIQESGQTLMALLNDVLDISKIEAGKLEIAPVDGDLEQTVSRIRQLFEPRAAEKGLRLAMTAAPGLPRVMRYDPVRVRQCVSNFLSNAIKFTERGEVSVDISHEPAEGGRHRVTIAVKDTGMGMDAETRERLFSPFMQADSSIARKFGGTGLGLAIARQLARLMGGEVSCDSAPGEGSTFRLVFLADPGEAAAVPQEAAEAKSQPQSVRPAENARLLLVDDNPLNRQVAKLFLKPISPVIVEAANGQEALDRLEAEPFDIVLLDVHMPVLDGRQTIARIRAADKPWRTVPVIALTADAMSGDKERYIAMGMDDYISKPIDQRELIAKIVTLLRGAEPKAVNG